MENPMIRPMLASDVRKQKNPDYIIDSLYWVGEVKLDGVRMIVVVEDSGIGLYSREMVDYTDRFPEIVRGFKGQPNGIYDGEVVNIDKEGNIHFTIAQKRAANSKLKDVESQSIENPCCFYVFDALEVEGTNIEHLGYLERKGRLRRAIKPNAIIHYLEHIENKRELYASECSKKAEGIILKDANAPYERKRSKSLLKWKRVEHDEPYIVGYAFGSEGKAYDSIIGHLVLARKDEEGIMHYMGGVGGGMSLVERIWIKRLLDKAQCPFGRDDIQGWRKGDEPKVERWVAPTIRCKVEYNTLTKYGRYRFPEFRGIITQDYEDWDWGRIREVSEGEIESFKQKMKRGDFITTKKWFYRAPTQRLKYILEARSLPTDKKKELLIADLANIILTDSELTQLGIPIKEYREGIK